MDWRIYYDNGTAFDSSQGAPHEAPAFGVLAVVEPDEMVGRGVLHRWNWYYWNPDAGQWWGGDLPGILDRLLHRLPVEALLQGRMADSRTFAEVLHRATNDPDFPVKSGWSQREAGE